MPITQLDNAPRCQHVKLSGQSCLAPARRGTDYCLFHTPEHSPNTRFDYPTVEDAHSVQFAVSEVLHALRAGSVDYRAAALMLYGLQIASGNLHRLALERGEELPSFVRSKKLKTGDPDSLAEAILRRLNLLDQHVEPEQTEAAESQSIQEPEVSSTTEG